MRPGWPHAIAISQQKAFEESHKHPSFDELALRFREDSSIASRLP